MNFDQDQVFKGTMTTWHILCEVQESIDQGHEISKWLSITCNLFLEMWME